MFFFIFPDDVAGVETAEDLGVEIVGGEVGVGRDLAAGGGAGPDPEIGGEMRGNQRRRRRVRRPRLKNPRTEPLIPLRLKETMPPIMEPMVWRWPRRRNPGPRVSLERGHEAESDVARGPGKDAGPGPGPGRDPSDQDLVRDDVGLAAETGGKAEAGPEGPDLGITGARRARETAELRRGKTRSLASREIMIRRRPDTRIRRTRSMKLSTWRSRILPKCFE